MSNFLLVTSRHYINETKNLDVLDTVRLLNGDLYNFVLFYNAIKENATVMLTKMYK